LETNPLRRVRALRSTPRDKQKQHGETEHSPTREAPMPTWAQRFHPMHLSKNIAAVMGQTRCGVGK
jgi:hypothetical protein